MFEGAFLITAPKWKQPEHPSALDTDNCGLSTERNNTQQLKWRTENK